MRVYWFASALVVVFASLAPDTQVANAFTERAPQEPIRVKVSVLPLAARIDVDGQVFTNPAVFERMRDNRVHSITVSAPGFVTSTTVVSFQRDVAVFVSLTSVETTDVDGNPLRASPLPALDRRVSLDPLDPWRESSAPSVAFGWTSEQQLPPTGWLSPRVILDRQDPWSAVDNADPQSGIVPNTVQLRFVRPRVALDLSDPWSR